MSTAVVAIIISASVALTVVSTALTKLALAVYRFSSRMDKSISYVESEMRHNGGSTLRDAVIRIDQRLHQLEVGVAGPTGPQGATGPRGASGTNSDDVVHIGDVVQLAETNPKGTQ